MRDYQDCPRCGIMCVPVNKNGTLRKHVRGLMTWLPKFGPICLPEPTGEQPEPTGDEQEQEQNRITRGNTE